MRKTTLKTLITLRIPDAIKRRQGASLLLFGGEMDSLQVSSGQERVNCQGGQSRVETDVYQDEAHNYVDGFLRRVLRARCCGCSLTWGL